MSTNTVTGTIGDEEKVGAYMTAVQLVWARTMRTRSWGIKDRHGSLLGIVAYYPRWRQYAYEPALDMASALSADCLIDLGRFVARANTEHAAARGRSSVARSEEGGE